MRTPHERTEPATASRAAESPASDTAESSVPHTADSPSANRSAAVDTDGSAGALPDTAAVKRALRALTTGSARTLDSDTVPGSGTSPDPGTSLVEGRSSPLTDPQPTAVVDRAHEALGDVDSAAAFLADGGVEQLRDAVATAERADEYATARAGQRALATVERYRRAAAGDHFHPGRGTVFRPGSQVRTE